MINRTNILNVNIDRYTKYQFGIFLKDAISKFKKNKVYKINTEFFQRALDDNKFLHVLNSSDINIVDGRGVLWAARYLTLPIANVKVFRCAQAIWQMIYSGIFIIIRPRYISTPILEAIPGVEAFKLLMRVAIENNVGVFIFGSSEKVLALAIKNIQNEFPELRIVGSLNGYDFQKNNKIDPVSVINKTDAKILIVALGSPRQEYWINENIDKLKSIKIAVGEGGTLDRIAYPSQKAPKFINQIGLEWLWRLFFNKSKTETRGRFKRFWNAVPVFIYQVVRWKIKNGQTIVGGVSES